MKKYFIIINVLLVTAGVYFGVRAFYSSWTAQLEQGVDVKTASFDQTASVKKEIQNPVTHYDPVIRRNLFKTITEEEEKAAAASVANPPVPDVKNEKELKPTTLKLKLMGTVTGCDKAYAIIQNEKGNEQKLYVAFDYIPDTQPQATVKEIRKDEVILDVNGEEQVLKMDEKFAAQDGTRKVSDAAPPGKAPVAVALKSTPIKLERLQIESAISNLPELMQQAKFRPFFKDGKPDGITLTRIKPNSIFTKLGLRNGDIITGVDGANIQSVDDALRFYESLKSSSTVNLQINRGGQMEAIEYTIE